MLADAVHLADRRAGGEELPVDLLLVGKRQADRRSGEERRTAARNERQDEIVGSESVHEAGHAQGRVPAPRVRHRMGGLDDLDPPAGRAMAVAGDDEPFEPSRQMRLGGGRHGGARLAGADDDDAPGGRRGKMRRHATLGIGGGDGGREEVRKTTRRIGCRHHACGPWLSQPVPP